MSIRTNFCRIGVAASHTLIWALATLFNAGMASGDEARFMQYPDIHGDRIVFSYENDLWTVGCAGRHRSADHDFPGKGDHGAVLAGRQVDRVQRQLRGLVRCVPHAGRRRRTETIDLFSRRGQVLGWTPDGTRVVIRSFMETFIYRDPNLYFVSREGSAPERLPD